MRKIPFAGIELIRPNVSEGYMVRATGALAVLELPYCRLQYYLLPPVYKCFALQDDTYVHMYAKDNK